MAAWRARCDGVTCSLLMAGLPQRHTSASAAGPEGATPRAGRLAATRPRRLQAMRRQDWVAGGAVGESALCCVLARGSPPGFVWQLLGGEPTCLLGHLSGDAGRVLEARRPIVGVGGLRPPSALALYLRCRARAITRSPRPANSRGCRQAA